MRRDTSVADDARRAREAIESNFFDKIRAQQKTTDRLRKALSEIVLTTADDVARGIGQRALMGHQPMCSCGQATCPEMGKDG